MYFIHCSIAQVPLINKGINKLCLTYNLYYHLSWAINGAIYSCAGGFGAPMPIIHFFLPSTAYYMGRGTYIYYY